MRGDREKKYGGYNYRAWALAVRHLSILKMHYLTRQFNPTNVLAIRSDCIYVGAERSTDNLDKLLDLPKTINPELYTIEKIKKIKIWEEDSLAFVDEKKELKLKSFLSGKPREELIAKLKEKFKE